jgi:hypothetical protein
MRRIVAVLCALVVCLVPGAAIAQTNDRDSNGADLERLAPAQPDQTAQRVMPPSQHAIGIRAFGAFDVDVMSASNSFKAVFGTSRFNGFGAGVDVTNIWHQVFLRVGVSHMSMAGNRAFDSNGTVTSLDVPLTATETPIEFGGGWRLRSSRGRRPMTPYGGGGLLLLKYSDVSEFALPGETTTATYKGSFVFGGVDMALSRLFVAGVEAQYRSVAVTPGNTSVLQASAFNENNLGGLTLRILFGIRK